ncbi:MAG: hypothetical protein QW757_03140, partial [Candidatus Woesearchaeota archaeon]
IEKTYISWIKNKLTSLYGYITTLIEFQKENILKNNINIINNTISSIDEFIAFFNKNILKIHYSLIEYKDLNKENFYILIRTFWINLLPDLINKLKFLKKDLNMFLKHKIEKLNFDKLIKLFSSVNKIFLEIRREINSFLSFEDVNQIDEKSPF